MNKMFKRYAPRHFLRARLSPDGYLGLPLTIGIAVLLLAVVVFATIAEAVVARGTLLLLLDAGPMQWLQAHVTPGRTALFFLVTHWHSTPGILVMATLLALWLTHKRSRDWVLRVGLSVPLGMLLNVLLKSIFQRQRPMFDQSLTTLRLTAFRAGTRRAPRYFMACWLLGC